MVITNYHSGILISILTFVLMLSFYSCNQTSILFEDSTAGMNGGFEISESGIPVNWILYIPKTDPAGGHEIVVDTNEFKEGKQSLKFIIHEGHSVTEGFPLSGLCNEYEAVPGDSYRISFWIKNDGCRFFIQIGGVSAGDGKYDTIVKSSETISAWRLMEYKYTMPTEYKFKRIRFDLNISNPGYFWIDDIRIDRV